MAEQYTERPTEIEVFPLGSETDVILRKSIAESETTGENGDVATCWQCEERQIRVPGTVSAEDIAADFEAWWEYTPGTKAQSVEDVRTETVAQMSATCNAAIVGGVDVTLTGGETKHFSLTLEDQLNLLSLQGRVASGADSVPYHQAKAAWWYVLTIPPQTLAGLRMPQPGGSCTRKAISTPCAATFWRWRP